MTFRLPARSRGTCKLLVGEWGAGRASSEGCVLPSGVLRLSAEVEGYFLYNKSALYSFCNLTQLLLRGLVKSNSVGHDQASPTSN